METLSTIRSILQIAINNIDNGTCSMTDRELENAIEIMQSLVNPNEILSKYQVAQKLEKSEKTVDNLIKAGKLPEGKKIVGLTAKLWYKKDIDKYLKNENNI